MIDWKPEKVSVRRQCNLLDISRSTTYDNREGRAASAADLSLMKSIDQLFLKDPTLGSRRMARQLRRDGFSVGRKRIQRLMRIMGLAPIYPRKKISQPGPDHRIYPYLLRNRKVQACDEVWCADITYIPMKHGYVYLFAILDGHSRRVLAWRISNTLDTSFCLEALGDAVKATGRLPEIFNTDQGSQFTSIAWIDRIKDLGVSISMDGKRAWIDNVIVERFWRSLKYEEVYLKAYENGHDATEQIGCYIERYNSWRAHSVHGDKTPDEVYTEAAA